MRREEQNNQIAVVEHLAWRGKPGVFAFHVPNGGWRSRPEAAILKGMGVRAGVPDLLIVFEGRLYALELKTPAGRLSQAQKDTHAALRAAGCEVATAVGLDQALDQLERWGLLRNRVLRGAA